MADSLYYMSAISQGGCIPGYVAGVRFPMRRFLKTILLFPGGKHEEGVQHTKAITGKLSIIHMQGSIFSGFI